MNDLSNAKTFGGIGALLSLIGIFIPYAGFIVSIVGLILLFMAVKTISEITKDNDIFRNYLYHFILSIITVGVMAVIMFIAFGAAGGFSWISDLQTAEITDFETFWSYFGELVVGCVVALFIGWILSIIAALYLRKSYKSIAKHTGVHLFDTTGLVYFIGAITTIILIGFIIILIARIIEIIAYFSLPDKLPTGGTKGKNDRKCPNCGKVIPEDARVCPYCGKNFEE
jgi:uncharacterized membrane protein